VERRDAFLIDEYFHEGRVMRHNGTLIGRSGPRLIVGPAHARAGTQIARFGTTLGGYIGG
jgi:hypothetical protein